MKIRFYLSVICALVPAALSAQSFGIYFLGGEILQYGGTNGDFGSGINGFYAIVPGSTDLTFDKTTALSLTDSGLATIKSFTYTQLVDGSLYAGPGGYTHAGVPAMEPLSVGEKVVVVFTDAISVASIGYKDQIGVLESPTFFSSTQNDNLLLGSFSVQVGTVGSLTLTYVGDPPDLPDAPPTPTVVSAAMRPGTTIMDIVFRIDDPGDATVKVRPLAFVDGVRSFANVVLPTTFVEGTDVNIGDAVPTNVDHTLSWNVAADWDIDLGNIKFEILCRDDGGLLPFEWITISPAAGGEPEMTISKNAPTDAEVLDAFFWQYANGDTGLNLLDGVLISNGNSYFPAASLVEGTTTLYHATPYILNLMDRALASQESVNFAIAARSSIQQTNSWHAINLPWQNDSLIIGWGSDSEGQTTPPVGLLNVTAISAGGFHSLALLDDGTVIGWGSDSEGQATPPDGLSNVTAISAGYLHSLALLQDGTVIGWGLDGAGQATPPEGLSNVIAISAGGFHSLALLDDGTVIGWGSNNKGQATPPGGLSNVTEISAGGYHNLALTINGTIVSWGSNDDAQATIPASLPIATEVAAGGAHSLALLYDGTVIGWGSNTHDQSSPPDGLSNITAISVGSFHSLALLDDSTVVAWGLDGVGQSTPPEGLSNVTAISAGDSSSISKVEIPLP